MTTQNSPKTPVLMDGIKVPVGRFSGPSTEGISVGMLGETLIISISEGDSALYVRLNQANFQTFTRSIAASVEAASCADQPGMGTVQ